MKKHEHQFNSVEAYFEKDDTLYVVLMCDYKKENDCWCGEQLVIQGNRVKVHDISLYKPKFYFFYTGTNDAWLGILNEKAEIENLPDGKKCVLSDKEGLELIKGVPLARG